MTKIQSLPSSAQPTNATITLPGAESDFSKTPITEFMTDRLIEHCFSPKRVYVYSLLGRTVSLNETQFETSNSQNQDKLLHDREWDRDHSLELEGQIYYTSLLRSTIERERAELKSVGKIDRSAVIIPGKGAELRDTSTTWTPDTSDKISLLDSCRALDMLAFVSSLRPDRRAENCRQFRNLRDEISGWQVGYSVDQDSECRTINRLLALRSSLLEEVGDKSRYLTKLESTSEIGPLYSPKG